MQMKLRLRDIPAWKEVLNIWSEIKASDRLPTHHKILLGFIMLLGIRISEALSITKGDIDFKREVVFIRQLKKRGTAHIREIPLSKDLLDLIKNSDWQAFKITRRGAYKIVKKWTGYRPHAFRHAFALQILKATKNLEIARRLLGHKNYDTLKIYLDYTTEDIRDEIMSIYKGV